MFSAIEAERDKMRRASHFAKADMLWSNTAYVDQWQKVMAVKDEQNNLRAVVKEAMPGIYSVLLNGDDDQAIYFLDDVELGSTGKNMEACFDIYCRLQYLTTPSYTPSYRRTEQINLYQIFPHTRVSAMRSGGFRVTTDDLSEIIAKALECYDEATNNGDTKVFHCAEVAGRDGFPDTIWEGGTKMHHVGDGAYCDDDGDNWEFL